MATDPAEAVTPADQRPASMLRRVDFDPGEPDLDVDLPSVERPAGRRTVRTHREPTDAGSTPAAARGDMTPAWLVHILNAVEADARSDPRTRNWKEDAARMVIGDIREFLVDHLTELRDEQADLMQRRRAAGLIDQAREHALRARTYKHARDVVRDLLSAGVVPALDGQQTPGGADVD